MRYNLCAEHRCSHLTKIKSTVAICTQKLDEKARVFAPVRNGKVAGAIPAESTFAILSIKGALYLMGLVLSV